MTGESDDARTPKDERAAVDSAWDALIDGATAEAQTRDAASADDERTPTDDERPKVESSPATASSGDKHPVATATRPVSGPHAAVGIDRTANPEEEMERLMSGAPPTLSPPADEDPSPAKAQGEADTDSKNDSKNEETSSTQAIDAMKNEGGEAEDRADSQESEDATGAPPSSETGDGSASDRPPLRLVRDDESPRAPRAARPTEPPAKPAPAPSSSSSPPWALIGVGVLALGAVAYFALGSDKTPAPAAPRTTADAIAPAAGPPPTTPPTNVDPVPTPPVEAGSDEAGSDDGADTTASAPPRSDDPRQPPPGTSPEAAAAFVRLPVSPSDGPPVGGIGGSGIHIDAISIGSRFESGDCRGQTDDFSVERREHVSVCLRVVHQRQKEELQVLWQKHGGSTRRSKIVVQPKHAYRTRGYLKLRKEYIGEWTVRVLSSDDIELARHDFTVTP